MSNPVNWFEIYVQDIRRAQKFYEAVLGIQMQEMPVPDVPDEGPFEMIFFPMEEGGPNATGALVMADGFPSGGNGTMVYFSCTDCSKEESRVEAAGGKVLKSKFSIGEYGFCSVCQDTDGNAFGLHSEK